MVACLNHGKSVNGTGCFASPSDNRKQCLEAFVTSAPKVTIPCICDLPQGSFDNGPRLARLDTRQAWIPCQINRRPDPRHRFASRMRNVDLNSGLLTGMEEQPELTVADDGGRRRSDDGHPPLAPVHATQRRAKRAGAARPGSQRIDKPLRRALALELA